MDHYSENDLLRYGYIIAHPKAKAFGRTQIYDKISIFNKEMALVRSIAKFDDFNEHFQLVTKIKSVMDLHRPTYFRFARSLIKRAKITDVKGDP